MQVPKKEPHSLVEVQIGIVINTSQQQPEEQPALLVQVKPPEADDTPLDAKELLEPTFALDELLLLACELELLLDVAPPTPWLVVPP